MAKIGTIVGGGFRLIAEHPKAVAIWALVQAVVGVIAMLVLMPQLAGVAAVQPGELPPNFGGFIGTMFLFSIIAWFVNAVLVCGVYRAVLRPEEGGLGFLRIGGDELRMFGLYVIFVIAGIFGYLVFALGLMLVTMVVAFVLQSIPLLAGLVSFLVMLAGFCALIYVVVRISMIFPMTFVRRELAIDTGWQISSGRFWTLFGAYFVIGLGLAVLGCIFVYAFYGDYIAALMQAGRDPEAIRAVQAAQMRKQMEMPIEWRAVTLVLGAAVQAVLLAITAGATATALRELLADKGQPVGGDSPFD